MQYMMLVVLQFTDVLISDIVLLDVAFTFFPIWTKGQMGQLLHFFMPGIFLVGLLDVRGGHLGSYNFILDIGGAFVSH